MRKMLATKKRRELPLAGSKRGNQIRDASRFDHHSSSETS
jgi:hypothetical protein